MTSLTEPATSPAAAVLRVYDPRSGSPVGTLGAATREEVALALSVSRAAQPDWTRMDPQRRGALLRSAANALAEGADALAEMNGRETGRPVDEALAGIRAGVATLEQHAELGPVHRGHSLRGSVLAADYTVAEARGVAVLLTPWNDPVAVAAGLIGAALVTGNTVIHKPSERCPHLGLLLGELLSRVFPPGVLLTLTGGPEVGAMLTTTDADVFAHVGSSASGLRIARAAVLTGAHVVRENGGNDPLVVDAGVDPAWAAEQAAIGAFSNSGQICTSVERIYVHQDIADPFCSALAEQARRRNAEHPLAPLVVTRLRDVVHAQVAHAIALGARATAGGAVPAGPGAYYPATVLLGCTERMEIMTEETFGPVAPVQVVADFAEGLRLASAGRYGLAATILTGSIEHAHRAVAALPVGTVKINAVFGGAPGGSAQPRGASGDGFGYGPELLDEFTRVKVVHVSIPPAADTPPESPQTDPVQTDTVQEPQ
ncbi:aldehyde dehydrogenase family protein [Paenarthrobacter sp. PH39-S1]|uniref:aldehyde dehydrogenase family protein n=1 Tax=Paenarthrobacter sp. PH39-S1 TaxID=3046204 RepID=UPI0024B9D9E7|nr:aldehyde dehydrogenase family protein [Paenarthrobacter sp. PH39-S1]MDJ0355349.1 aldehyde dehydrogenase family protein [Paenarthrobacter sp. PH39-S1]